MDFFAFPTEIRLKIYSSLLVHYDAINISATVRGELASSLCPARIDLWPALLRVSKQVYGEAIGLLYSHNCFRFSDPGPTSAQDHTAVAAFLRKIGAQARLLRHVCIGFHPAPLAEDHGLDPTIGEVSLNNLDLLRDACPSLTTLELLLPLERADLDFHESATFANSLDLMDTRLKAFQFLQEVKVDITLLDWDSDEESDVGTEDPENDEQEDVEDDCVKIHSLKRRLCDRGWAVNVTKISPVEHIWSDPDDMMEFGSEDDYDDGDDDEYMTDLLRVEAEEEVERWERYYREMRAQMDRPDCADDGGPA